MTVSVTARRESAEGDGTTTVFSVPFPFYEIDVYLDGLIVDPSEYTITQNQPGNTGSITFNTPPASGSTITIVSETEKKQEVSYDPDTGLHPLEKQLDRAMLAIQDLSDRLARTVRVPVPAPEQAPVDMAAKPNSIFHTDGQGQVSLSPLDTVAGDYLASAQAARDQAAASAAAAADSEQNAAESAQDAADAAAAAQDAMSSMLLPQFANLAAAQAYDPDVAPDYIQLAGYYSAGDGGAALYRRASSEPSHPGKFQSADGTWWELAENVVNPRIFGVKGDGATDDAVAFQKAAAVYQALNVDFWCPPGDYNLSSKVSFLPPTNSGAGSLPPPTVRFSQRAVLKAIAPITGGLVEFGAPNWPGIIQRGHIEGGLFDANNLADHGLHIMFANNCLVFNCHARNYKKYGFNAGTLSAPQRSYEVLFDQCKTTRIGDAKPILNITNTNPAVVTVLGGAFPNGEKVNIQGVVGMTEVNNKIFVVANAQGDTFELEGVDATGYSAYESGGSAFSGHAPEGSVGIYFEYCGDSHASNCVIIGNEIGFSGAAPGIFGGKWNNNHVWNWEFNGRMRYGFDMGGSNQLVGCQVDAHADYAYRFTSNMNSLIGCNVVWEPASRDNQDYPVLIESGGGVVTIGCSWKAHSPTARLAGIATGDLSQFASLYDRVQNMVQKPRDHFRRNNVDEEVIHLFENSHSGENANFQHQLKSNAGILFQIVRSLAGGGTAVLDWTGPNAFSISAGNNGAPIALRTSYTDRLRIDKDGNVVVGNGALATDANNGFLYIPTCAGAPTGNPPAYSGRLPLVYDATNNRLYIRASGGTWRSVAMT
jgi:hypothetical protein